jgi:hypothetical protein
VWRKRRKEKIISSMPLRKYRIFLHEVKAPEMHLPSDSFGLTPRGEDAVLSQPPRSNLRAVGADFFVSREGRA